MKVRIGIDVGGTFTDAVCVNSETFELIGYLKIPTTHTANEGVSKGIVEACRKLLEKYKLDPADVTFIAHGTTQATNALLEGDVEDVGIVCVGEGASSYKSKMDTNIGDIELAKGKFLHTKHHYLDIKSESSCEEAYALAEQWKKEGIHVAVAASAFSVDDPSKEIQLMKTFSEKDFLSTGTHEVSKLYGLRVRTRTAAINASILPKMIETAVMTEDSVKESGVAAPLMIMRCDGGVMDISEIKKRPVLTMLSGPAAGVAGALMYEKISDGIFLEVGGTSTDISAIKNGRVMLKYAEVGGHKTYVNSLDIRTIGIAGGSMVRFDDKGVLDSGPRSAHIANLPYACYAKPEEIINPKVVMFCPRKGDPQDYGIIECADGKRYALTVSCAANYLGYIKKEHYSFGNKESAGKAIEAFAKKYGVTADEIARQIMDRAVDKVIPVVKELLETYELEPKFTSLVGGGGGAAAIVPYTGERMGMKNRISKNAEVISPIGVALAMVRDVVERIIINPTQADMARLRTEAFDMAVSAGANPETVDVFSEIESEKNLVRAIASGTTELRTKELLLKKKEPYELRAMAAEAMEVPLENTEIVASTGKMYAIYGKTIKKSLFGLLKKESRSVVLIDEEGVIRLQKSRGEVREISVENCRQQLNIIVSQNSEFSDGGEALPDIFLFFNKQIKSFTGMGEREQIVSLALLELESLDPKTKVWVLACKK